MTYRSIHDILSVLYLHVQSCFTRVSDITSCRRWLRSSASHRLGVSPDRLSIQCWQADVSGFWCHRLKRPASPCRICAVTRGFQTTTQGLSVFPFLPRRYHMTHALNYHHSSVLSGHQACGPCSNQHYLGHVKMSTMMTTMCGGLVTTSWVKCPLCVSQPGQLSLPSIWDR